MWQRVGYHPLQGLLLLLLGAACKTPCVPACWCCHGLLPSHILLSCCCCCCCQACPYCLYGMLVGISQGKAGCYTVHTFETSVGVGGCSNNSASGCC